ncbi:MAG: sulfite exporter TauE/SafE family protein, partial [Clostridia bacterium]|nr:sulfite exporter TauE/SafE family protein [Clostridia bacterium]
MLVVPVLTVLFGLEERKAHATAIAIILPLCAVGAVVYFLRGTYDYSMFPYAIFGVISGGIIGAFLLKKASNNALKILFYGVMLLAGFKMLI